LKTQLIIRKYCPSFLEPFWFKIMQSPNALRMVNGAFWSLSGAIISRGFTLISSIFIARLLGTKGFGEFGIIQSTIGMFGMFAGLSLGMTATKYIAQFRNVDKEKTSKIISLTVFIATIGSAIISVILFLMSHWLATNTLASPKLTSILQIGSLYLFFLSIVGLQNGILAGFEAFKTIAFRSLISGISTFPLMVGGVYFFGLKGAVWGLVGSSLINVILNYIVIDKIYNINGIKIIKKNIFSEKSLLYEFALPAFLAGIMVGPVSWACNTILINHPSGYSEMGVYNAANQWLAIILFIPGSLGSILLPLLTNLNQEENSIKYKQMLKYNLVVNIFIASTISLFVIIFSHLIISSYGTSFSTGQPVLVILALTAILISYNSVIGQAIASKGKMWIGFSVNFAWAIVLILFTYLFTKNGEGAYGLAKANLYAYFFLSLTTTLIIKYHNK